MCTAGCQLLLGGTCTRAAQLSAQGALGSLPCALRDAAILLQGCTSAMFFEARKRKDCYLWLSKVPSGPTAKFLIVNGAPAAYLFPFFCCFALASVQPPRRAVLPTCPCPLVEMWHTASVAA